MADWGYRRFILHYAHLCRLAGGVSAFCVGSELRGLTQLRGEGDSFPAVEALRLLVAEVRAILGPECKISYAADWSEYWGYKSPEGDRYFHLDPLWADPEVDFIGIDNYMPLSDWREGEAHADASWGEVYDLGYLKANVAGGEGFDWYYPSEAAAERQLREPIEDGAYGEPWVWRPKDLAGWWGNTHHERLGGLRALEPTAWVPGSKPFWFTELGCAAVDKGTNAPNLFVDAKSSESFLPRGSTGRRDDLVQMQYLRAMAEFWGDESNNPVSSLYGGRMVEMSRAFVWAWDARPFPQFPAREELWSDGGNWLRGHWISGRAAGQVLASVITELCHEAGVSAIDVSKVNGLVRGFERPSGTSARAALQVLMLAHGIEASEREGVLHFHPRHARVMAHLGADDLAIHPETKGDWEVLRGAEAEAADRVRIGFIEAEGDFAASVEEAASGAGGEVSANDLPLVLTRGEARGLAERWLAETSIAREGVRFALPPSRLDIGAGDVVELGEAGRFRIDRVESAGLRLLEGVRVEAGPYHPSDQAIEGVKLKLHEAGGPLEAVFLDLPTLGEGEQEGAPWLAVSAQSWAGAAAVWQAPEDAGYELMKLISKPAVMGVTRSALHAAPSGRWDRGGPLRIKLLRGALASVDEARLFEGANAMAIGDGASGVWEVFQFRDAKMIAPREWEVTMRLRGQGGTEAVMPAVWPEGSVVVLLGEGVDQIEHPNAWRGVQRHYRIGEALLGWGDWAVRHIPQAFQGVGLRPLSPVHLRVERQDGEDRFHWIRRTRVQGDDWLAEEVPLGEARERYRLRVLHQGTEVRRLDVLTSEWRYGALERQADGVLGDYVIEVAQVSDQVGAGAFARLDVTN